MLGLGGPHSKTLPSSQETAEVWVMKSFPELQLLVPSWPGVTPFIWHVPAHDNPHLFTFTGVWTDNHKGWLMNLNPEAVKPWRCSADRGAGAQQGVLCIQEPTQTSLQTPPSWTQRSFDSSVPSSSSLNTKCKVYVLHTSDDYAAAADDDEHPKMIMMTKSRHCCFRKNKRIIFRGAGMFSRFFFN